MLDVDKYTYIYIIKQDIIYIYVVYRQLGQTAGPNGLKFFVETHGPAWMALGVLGRNKNEIKKQTNSLTGNAGPFS